MRRKNFIGYLQGAGFAIGLMAVGAFAALAALAVTILPPMPGTLPPPGVPVERGLTWPYPADELTTNVTFHVVTTTNISTPLASWTPFTNAIGTNSIRISFLPGVNFFAVYASNYWGRGDFSDAALTPAMPRGGLKPSLTP